ncbi:hypothetical protein LMG28614_04123 [Paraburkholderia ultramafica]|uniref:Uncharacterized protein n=1 Tax=Paraburkholderia ultramafica TaxID=1544867 RepID=A0A6S7BLE5_9BURK|nr:hypothetical protein LMG28614_04123 [Paraburkholderia ultramafica]
MLTSYLSMVFEHVEHLVPAQYVHGKLSLQRVLLRNEARLFLHSYIRGSARDKVVPAERWLEGQSFLDFRAQLVRRHRMFISPILAFALNSLKHAGFCVRSVDVNTSLRLSGATMHRCHRVFPMRGIEVAREAFKRLPVTRRW